MMMIDNHEIKEVFCPHCHMWVEEYKLLPISETYASLKACPLCLGTVVYFK